MASKKLNELVLRATKGELTERDLNEVVLAFADSEETQNRDIKDLKISDRKQGRDLSDIKEEYPLLPPEADDLSKEVKKKGVAVMGGKKSNAYNNVELRKRVYRDIWHEVKRQYGLVDEVGRQQSYKKLKRKYFKGALITVGEYELPINLANDIEEENEFDIA